MSLRDLVKPLSSWSVNQILRDASTENYQIRGQKCIKKSYLDRGQQWGRNQMCKSLCHLFK